MSAIHSRKSLSTGSHMNANTIKDLHVLEKSINTFRQMQNSENPQLLVYLQKIIIPTPQREWKFKQGEGGGGLFQRPKKFQRF